MVSRRRKVVTVSAGSIAEAKRVARKENPGYTVVGYGSPVKSYSIWLEPKLPPLKRKKK